MQKEFETPREPELPKPYLDNGSAFPDFVYQDMNGKEISSKTLRGKYVYIDFWATWCGPCAKELPPLKELEEKMEGKNIVFVSISCDRVRADWEKVVKEKKLGGIQLHIGNDQNFFDTYRTYYIPHFMLIDRKGKIIDSHTTRPSDPETEKTLMGLKGI